MTKKSWWKRFKEAAKKRALQGAIAASTLLPARAAAQDHSAPVDNTHHTTAAANLPIPAAAAPLPISSNLSDYEDLGIMLAVDGFPQDKGTQDNPLLVTWENFETISVDHATRKIELTQSGGGGAKDIYPEGYFIYGASKADLQAGKPAEPLSAAAIAAAGQTQPAADAAPKGDGKYHVTASPDKQTVFIQYPNGATVTRIGGDASIRNNNPGNMVPGKFANAHGAIGQNGKDWAVFPDWETGKNAAIALLKTPEFQNLTIDETVSRWVTGYNDRTVQGQATVRSIANYSSEDGKTKIVSQFDQAQFDHFLQALFQSEGSKKCQEIFNGDPPISGPPDHDHDHDGDHSHDSHSNDNGAGAAAAAGGLAGAIKGLFGSVSSTLLVGAGTAAGLIYLANRETPEKDTTDIDVAAPAGQPAPVQSSRPARAASPALPAPRPHAHTPSASASSFVGEMPQTRFTDRIASERAAAAKKSQWFSSERLAMVAAIAGAGVVTYMAVGNARRGR